MENIGLATKEDFLQIQSLWIDAFGKDIYYKWFFKNLYKPENAIVYRLNGECVSVLHRIPYNIVNLGNVSYIYGASTKPSVQKRGIMGKLLKYSEMLDYKESNIGSILIPASESLFDFYLKYGFNVISYCNKEKYINSYSDEKAELVACDSEISTDLYKKDIIVKELIVSSSDNIEYCNQMIKLYESKMNDRFFIKRDCVELKRQISYFTQTGGGAIVVLEGHIFKGYAFFYKDSNTIEVKELCCENSIYENKLLDYLCLKQKNNIFVTNISLELTKPHGAIKLYLEDLTNKNFYMGLLYD